MMKVSRLAVFVVGCVPARIWARQCPGMLFCRGKMNTSNTGMNPPIRAGLKKANYFLQDLELRNKAWLCAEKQHDAILLTSSALTVWMFAPALRSRSSICV